MKRGSGRPLLWLLLALPGAAMLRDLMAGSVLSMDLLHPSGEMAIRLMILAMLPGPLAFAFRAGRFLRTWLELRRDFGLAGFAYALFHLWLYVDDMQFALPALVEELGLPAIATGWLGLLALLPPALISSDRAMRALGRTWKRVQRLVYPAMLLSLAHWLLLDWHWQPALVHLTPLLLAWGLRARRLRQLARPQGA